MILRLFRLDLFSSSSSFSNRYCCVWENSLRSSCEVPPLRQRSSVQHLYLWLLSHFPSDLIYACRHSPVHNSCKCWGQQRCYCLSDPTLDFFQSSSRHLWGMCGIPCLFHCHIICHNGFLCAEERQWSKGRAVLDQIPINAGRHWQEGGGSQGRGRPLAFHVGFICCPPRAAA